MKIKIKFKCDHCLKELPGCELGNNIHGDDILCRMCLARLDYMEAGDDYKALYIAQVLIAEIYDDRIKKGL